MGTWGQTKRPEATRRSVWCDKNQYNEPPRSRVLKRGDLNAAEESESRGSLKLRGIRDVRERRKATTEMVEISVFSQNRLDGW